jgi:hypothetical protein
MATLYDIISELRREHPNPAASKTLDLVVSELGQTRDNLKLALAHLEQRPLPAGGKAVLEELAARARAEGLYDYSVPLTPDELRASSEPVEGSDLGIALLLGGSAVLMLGLAVAACVAGVLSIIQSS